jgi:hypothetical protein
MSVAGVGALFIVQSFVMRLLVPNVTASRMLKPTK